MSNWIKCHFLCHNKFYLQAAPFWKPMIVAMIYISSQDRYKRPLDNPENWFEG